MKRKRKFLLFILLLLCLCLLGGFLYFFWHGRENIEHTDLEENAPVLNIVDKEEVIHNDEENVSSEEEKEVVDKQPELPSKENTDKTEIEVNSPTKKPSSSSSSNTNDSAHAPSSGNTGETTNPPVHEPEEEVDSNDLYRKSIESSYGITIKYGNEIGNYQPKRLTPVPMTDSSTIKTYLGYIETELKKYPSGFFRDFEGMPLTIYLVESVPGNSFVGFTDKEFMNDIKITLVKDFSFSYTLNHEIMHYIDAYLEIKMYPNDPYQEYVQYNPEGYQYGNVNPAYNYGYNGQTTGAYFLSSYAQSNVREDRAEVFKQMMTRVYKPVGMFNDGEVLKNKALLLSSQIKTYFPSASGTQYWDKIIN